MRQQILLVTIFFIAFYGCRNKPTIPQAPIALRDSLLTRINALAEVDTTENYYRLLKAYTSNDTTYLRNYISDIERYNNAIPPLHFIDSCARQPNLQDLNAKEAYRFIYRTAICPYEINITITKVADSPTLHFAISEQKNDSIICVNEYDKPLDEKDWKGITQSLTKNDFWGRRKYNGAHGIDGSELTVIGYKKGDSTHWSLYNHVYRWMIGDEETLMKSFHLALKLSGNRQGCIGVIRAAYND